MLNHLLKKFFCPSLVIKVTNNIQHDVKTETIEEGVCAEGEILTNSGFPFSFFHFFHLSPLFPFFSFISFSPFLLFFIFGFHSPFPYHFSEEKVEEEGRIPTPEHLSGISIKVEKIEIKSQEDADATPILDEPAEQQTSTVPNGFPFPLFLVFFSPFLKFLDLFFFFLFFSPISFQTIKLKGQKKHKRNQLMQANVIFILLGKKKREENLRKS